MKRTKKKEAADAILTSDLHLTDSVPVSRTDDYQEAQERKIEFLQDLSDKNNGCPILCAGDVFDYWKASPALMLWVYYHIPTPFVTIPGQHDLPGHSLTEYYRSALGLLDAVFSWDNFRVLLHNLDETADKFCVYGIPFGMVDDFDPKEIKFPKGKRRILMLHQLTWLDTYPIWGQGQGFTSSGIFAKYGEYFDLILTGDNHKGFMQEAGNTLLVNPGSMMRSTADQIDYEPSCYLYYAETNTVEKVNFPIKKNVHNREHIDVKKQREERIAAYIERMSADWEIGLSFEKNLEAHFIENSVPKKVQEIIWAAMEE